MNIKYRLKKSFLYPIWQKIQLASFIWNTKRSLLQEAQLKFIEEKPEHGSLADYRSALKRHFVSYSEYMHQYEFWHLSEAERNQYIARNALRTFYFKIPPEIKGVFWNKVEFLNRFSKYIFREWICARDVSLGVFCAFVKDRDCIVKPMADCCGAGIYKISISQKSDLVQLYNQCAKDNALIEECINGCDELQSFHPQSLNSIRVVTITTEKETIVFGAFLRMGMGNSVIDNAHAGGIFAQINVESGQIESDGIDSDGHRYVMHPDTHKQIKGFVIPRWEEIKSTCIEAARIVSGNPITGWDVVINQSGKIEFVEGNHGPDFDVMQSPLKIGVKVKLCKYIKLNKCR